MTHGGSPRLPPGMAVTDHQLAETIESLIRDANTFTSLNGVVQQLESKLGVDLGHKVGFIRTQIHRYLILQSPPQNFMLDQQKDHIPLDTNPNFHPAPSPLLPQNIEVLLPAEAYGFRPPLPTHARLPQASPPLVPSSVSNIPSVAVSRVTAKASAPAGRKRRGGPGGLNKLCGVSPELQIIVGQPTLPRTEIVKQLWAYIRKNNLQDPNNKRNIICNDELRLVFETDCTDMFKMNKLLAKHIIALEPTRQAAQCTKKQKVDAEYGSQSDDPVPVVVISDALGRFLGTNEKEI